ncbi:MAG: hypothetical protein M1838_000646 [Thelocarpon superellum]|nr:MAG: hypothetical protein M1838_000646 [Thelocarpon superellum]
MSNVSQQNPSQARQQPTSYPSPHSYPSPSMSAYAYPPPQQQQAVEPYRASPTGSHVSLPSLNLPPLRHIGGPGNPQPGQAPMGSPLPPPTAPMTGYYPQSLPPPQHAMGVTSSPHNQPLRYPLPQPDGRIMSGGRHKKEIKRRTKTGCLTCRKRRIKCDEAHPTCRNCQKSKRECLGYDPIFKAQPGPPAIQPAPASGSPMNQGSLTSAGSYQTMPQQYVPPVSGSYPPALSATGSSPASSVEPYDYSSAIDPALEAAGPAHMAVPPTAYDASQGYRPDLKRGLDSASPYSTATSDAQNPRAKRIKMEDILPAGGDVPPPLTPPRDLSLPLPPDTLAQIARFVVTTCAPALDAFLETKWYAAQVAPWLLNDVELCEQIANLLDRQHATHRNRDQPDPPVPHPDRILSANLEMKICWGLLRLARTAAAKRAVAADAAADTKDVALEETIRRLSIFEHLVTGTVAEANVADLARLGSVQHNELKMRELEFWRFMGKFVTLCDDEASAAKEMDDTLAGARKVLKGQENRDVIYSMAVARHLSQRLGEAPEAQPADRITEKIPMHQLWVAKKFVQVQADGHGTTPMMQRLCGMAVRSWSMYK